MLKLMMELNGSFPKYVLRKGTLTSQHFNNDFEFISVEIDKISGKQCTRTLPIIDVKPMKDRLKPCDDAMFNDFLHFLNRCLTSAPEKRMTPQEAFRHPFLTSQY